MLAGAFRGKRVVFLKQLASGLLLVTGPFKVNGVPMRRCTASACIATSTKLDISGVSVPEHVNDAYFKRAAAPKKTEDGIFEQNEAKYTVSIPLFFSPILTRAKFKLNSFRPLNKERPTKRLSMPVFCPPSPLTNSWRDTLLKNSVSPVVNTHTTWNSKYLVSIKGIDWYIYCFIMHFVHSSQCVRLAKDLSIFSCWPPSHCFLDRQGFGVVSCWSFRVA